MRIVSTGSAMTGDVDTGTTASSRSIGAVTQKGRGEMMGYVIVLLAGILTGILITVLAAVGYVYHKKGADVENVDESQP